jgi:hypothetical protein
MSTSVNGLLETVGLNTSRLKTAKWGQTLESSSIGIYFVSTSKDPNSFATLYDNAPIDENILKFWIKKVSTIQVDGKPATVENLKQRLNSFWLPDENIIYIGQTESSKGLRGRVNQYYNTELGERKPHAGGHWIKTLKILNELFVHYIPSQNAEDTEKKIMRNFVSQVSEQTKKILFDTTLPIPFANLELEQGNRKNHGISKSKISNLLTKI